jgi:hypothetical protein
VSGLNRRARFEGGAVEEAAIVGKIPDFRVQKSSQEVTIT